MVRIDLVRDKVRRLRDTAEALRRVLPPDDSSLGGDRDARDLIAFRVYLVMQETIDLCSHVLADKGWGPAPSLRDHFVIMADHGVLDAALAQRLAAGIKIRNLIGHAYGEIDPAKLRSAAAELVDLVDPFCAAVIEFAESSPS